MLKGEKAIKLINDLLPFLEEKKPQAKLLLEFFNTGSYRGKEVPLNVKKKRAKIDKALRELKKVEYAI